MLRIKTKGIATAASQSLKWEQRLDRNALRLIRREANILRGDIVRGIRSQAPGGDKFLPLSPQTIRRKGSSKALIDRGDLIRSVNVSDFEGGKVIFVGVNRQEQDSEGNMLEDIAATHEYGSGPSASPQIPPRPFLRPAFREWLKVGPPRFAQDLAKSMGVA